MSADGPRRKKNEKKKKETEIYKSAQFIEDSDAEYGDMETFLEKEKAIRTRAEAAGTGSATMKPTGTKKRRRNAVKGSSKLKKRPAEHYSPDLDDEQDHADREVEVVETEYDAESLVPPRLRPKPRLRKKDDASVQGFDSTSETHVDEALDTSRTIDI